MSASRIKPDGGRRKSEAADHPLSGQINGYSVPMKAGIEAANRELLERLHREAKGPFTVAEAAKALAAPLERAQRLVLYLYSRGWLSRVRHGLYVVVPLGATDPSAWREEPWIVATKVFTPCFMGGWSACEHWSLTEQVFRAVQVHTARPVRSVEEEIQGTPFRLRHVPLEKHFGLKAVWHGQIKTQVSDPTRTLVDILDAPVLGGGIRHAADILRAYDESEHRNYTLLFEYAERLRNRTIYKRFGYLIEILGLDRPGETETCRSRLSAGVSLLDPSAPANGSITKRWNLRINAKISKHEQPS